MQISFVGKSLTTISLFIWSPLKHSGLPSTVAVLQNGVCTFCTVAIKQLIYYLWIDEPPVQVDWWVGSSPRSASWISLVYCDALLMYNGNYRYQQLITITAQVSQLGQATSIRKDSGNSCKWCDETKVSQLRVHKWVGSWCQRLMKTKAEEESKQAGVQWQSETVSVTNMVWGWCVLCFGIGKFSLCMLLFFRQAFQDTGKKVFQSNPHNTAVNPTVHWT